MATNTSVLSHKATRSITGSLCGLALLLLLNGCEWGNPISDPSACVHDQRLFGTWRGESGNYKSEVLVIGKSERSVDGAPKGLTEAVSVIVGRSGYLATEHFCFLTTKVGDDSYAMILVTDAHEASVYKILTTTSSKERFDISKYKFLFVKYEISGDSLNVWMLNYENIGKMIKNGLLKGTSKALTSSTAEIVTFLQSDHSKDLFDLKSTYTREKDTTGKR